jgi:phosphopantothenoylcysteine decarboxylase / phosphopantothenate---cysteine ligase
MRIVLGIAGGIAAYKAPDLVRHFRRAGHEVRCVVTSAGSRLVAADALAAVSGNPVATELFPADGSMPHITLARWASCIVVAPATADLLSRCAYGLADDLLTTLILAADPQVPVVYCPAMNTVMWHKPVVREACARLSGHGARMVDPVPGDLACGETGIGAMAPPETILAAVAALDVGGG